jgi:DNA polymerase V
MRTVLELAGTPAITLEEERIGKEQLIFSRSFSDPLTTREGMRQVLSVYGQQAAARLVRQPPEGQAPHGLRRNQPLRRPA